MKLIALNVSLFTDDVEKKEITLYCENVIKIIDNAGHADQRLTSAKLLDAWQGKGPGILRVKVFVSLSFSK